MPTHSQDDLEERLAPDGLHDDLGPEVRATLSPMPLSSPREVALNPGPCATSRSSQERTDAANGIQTNLYLRAALMFLVIALGSLDIILRQVVAKTLSRFSYMIGLATAAAYLPVFWIILLTLMKIGVVPVEQLRWVWAGGGNLLTSLHKGIFSAPYLKLFFVAALGDTIGNGLGFICTPYVSGPAHSLLAQFTIMFTAIFSMCVLRKGYSLAQILALIGVEVTVLIGVLPNLGNGENSSNPFFSLLLAFSCAFNAIAWVMKETIFRIYTQSAVEDVVDYEAISPLRGDEKSAKPEPREREMTMEMSGPLKQQREDTLHIFVVNSHVCLFQLPLTLLLMPLAQATGQTQGQNLVDYLLDGIGCLGGNSDVGALCSHSATYTMYYVIINIIWNWTVLLNVKINGALATFVALKAMSPCSAVLFAYVDWPLLHKTPVKPLSWLAFAMIMPLIGFYVWASKQQQQREDEQPASATCCWPLWTDNAPSRCCHRTGTDEATQRRDGEVSR